MKLCLTILGVAVLMGLAHSVPCIDGCTAACDIANRNCEEALVLGPLCEATYSHCQTECSSMCACDLSCHVECQPGKEACDARASENVVFKLECAAQNDVCIVNCHAVCAVQTTFQIVTGALSGGVQETNK